MCVLLLTLGFLALGSNIGSSEAHLLGAGDFRNPLDPYNVLDDIFKNIPGLGRPAVGGPHAGAIGPFGPYGVNIPGVNSFEDYMRFLGLPPQRHNFGALPGPYVPTIPHLPPVGSFGNPFNPQGNLPGPQVPHQPLLPHGGDGSGFPVQPDSYPPVVGPQQPHGNSPGTGPVPSQPGSGGGGPALPQGPVTPPKPTIPSGPVAPSRPVVPSGPTVPQTPVNKPAKQPAPGGDSNPPGEGADDGAPCDQPECEPGGNDSYIHLIDPRKGKN